MRILRRLTALLILTIVSIALALWLRFPHLSSYLVDGSLSIQGLSSSVHIARDEKGMAFVSAETIGDALVGQGFATAQDRIFQMELARRAAQGRLSELFGQRARDLDVEHRTYGFHRLARRHARLLDDQTYELFERYATGVNRFLEMGASQLPLEFRVLRHDPEPWRVEDSLSILYLMGWNSSADLRHEVIRSLLVEHLGLARAVEIFPLNINPDVEESEPRHDAEMAKNWDPVTRIDSDLSRAAARLLSGGTEPLPFELGSNNWVVAGSRSAAGLPIVAGDPHLDPRQLPGVWHPIGLILPDNRAVGATVPGIPGISIGRTLHVALAMTNAYGDVQDLFIESVDPDNPNHYLEDNSSIPFEIDTEIIHFPDGRREEVLVRSTRRGPIVSDLLPTAKTAHQQLSLRWAPAESMGPKIGILELLRARSTDDVERSLKHLTPIILNFVFADTAGNIGWRVSGRLPRRAAGAGELPWSVAATTVDPWQGWIPASEMPASSNPGRGWVGTANHFTIGPDYPHYYSGYAASSYRYRRLAEELDRSLLMTADDHWQLQLDDRNEHAARVAPVLLELLASAIETENNQDFVELLASWDYRDRTDSAASTIFQELYRQLVSAVFEDELGDEIAPTFLERWYFWQERLDAMILDGESPWFDDVRTPDREELADLISAAARATRTRLAPTLGANPQEWRWGRLHTISFFHALRRTGFGSSWLGSGPHPMGGSGDTLLRARYAFSEPFAIRSTASLRMVVDLADDERIMAVLPGGVTARALHPHHKDQIASWLSGEARYWWFSDREILAHTKSRLTLSPP